MEEEELNEERCAPFDPTAFLRQQNEAQPVPESAEPNEEKPIKKPIIIHLKKSPDELETSSEEQPKEENSPEKEDGLSDAEKWRCPICLEGLQQPVVTHCGHVFCYPCITEWLRRSNSCPVCHGEIENSQLIPIYGQGSEADINSPPPPRPEYREARRLPNMIRIPGFQFRYVLNENNIRSFFTITPQKILLFVALMFLIFTFYV